MKCRPFRAHTEMVVSKKRWMGGHRAPTCKPNEQNPTTLMISVVKDGLFLQPQWCMPWSSSSWLLLSILRKIWPYSSGKEQNSNPVEWFLWMVCHLCTIRKPVSWLSPTIQIYLKRCRLSDVGTHGLPPSPITAYCPACALSFYSMEGLLMQLLACLCMYPALLSQCDFKAHLGQIHFILNGFLISWPLCLFLRIRAGVFFMFYAQYKAQQIIWHRVTIYYFSYFWTQLLGEIFQMDICETNCLVSST